MQTVLKPDKLRQLFQAFRLRDDAGFLRVARSIISEELAANHHVAATELQRALGSGPSVTDKPPVSLHLLPKERRSEENLLYIDPEIASVPELMLTKGTEKKITRFLDEHRRSGHLAKYGYQPKRRLLFWGPPGCGKTLTARYVAGQLGLPFAVLRLSAVISSFVGDTSTNLQRVFDRANRTPMVLLLDEVDALGKKRDDPNDVGELKRVVNSLLQALDGFQSSQSVVIAASNHQYLLDPALWRRFEDVIAFPMPDSAAKSRQLKRLLDGVQIKGSLAGVVKNMSNLSFADVERIAVEAVKTMVLQDRTVLNVNDLQTELKEWKTARSLAQAKNGVRAR
jgi:SpoVK/Ycf46/Vps4 family AAA+-type ATPase